LLSKSWMKKPLILASIKQKKLIAGRRACHSSRAKPIMARTEKMVRNFVMV